MSTKKNNKNICSYEGCMGTPHSLNIYSKIHCSDHDNICDACGCIGAGTEEDREHNLCYSCTLKDTTVIENQIKRRVNTLMGQPEGEQGQCSQCHRGTLTIIRTEEFPGGRCQQCINRVDIEEAARDRTQAEIEAFQAKCVSAEEEKAMKRALKQQEEKKCGSCGKEVVDEVNRKGKLYCSYWCVLEDQEEEEEESNNKRPAPKEKETNSNKRHKPALVEVDENGDFASSVLTFAQLAELKSIRTHVMQEMMNVSSISLAVSRAMATSASLVAQFTNKKDLSQWHSILSNC